MAVVASSVSVSVRVGRIKVSEIWSEPARPHIPLFNVPLFILDRPGNGHWPLEADTIRIYGTTGTTAYVIRELMQISPGLII